MAVLYVGNREVSKTNPLPIQSALDAIRNLRPLGYDQVEVNSTDIIVPQVPENATIAQIKPEGGGIRYVDTAESPDPSPTFGFPIEESETLIYDAMMTDIRIIGMVDNVTLNILFYGVNENA